MKIEKISEDAGYLEITEEDYREDVASGVPQDEALKPGRHKFMRGAFRKRYPDSDPATVKTTVYIRLGLDSEVLDYFKWLAQETEADSIETPIKQALQAAMEQGRQQPLPAQADALLDNTQFIEAVAERVKRISSKKPAVKKVAPADKSRRRAA